MAIDREDNSRAPSELNGLNTSLKELNKIPTKEPVPSAVHQCDNLGDILAFAKRLEHLSKSLSFQPFVISQKTLRVLFFPAMGWK